jgi:hypothetical protein
MELEGSLLCSQDPATGHYSEPDESGPIRLGAAIGQWYSAGTRNGWSEVRVPAGAWAFISLCYHRVQTGCGAQPAPVQLVQGVFPWE